MRAHRQQNTNLKREIEATQSVTGQRVGTTLQNDSCRSIHLHNFAHYWLEDELVGMIIHAVLKRYVDRVVLALLVAGVTNITSA